MSKTKTAILANRKITAIFLIGAILLIVGVAIFTYTDGMIQVNQQVLQNPNLTQQQRWAVEGSLQWWIIMKAALYGPLSITLMTAGLIALLYVILWAIVQPQ